MSLHNDYNINTLPLCVLHRIFNELSPRDLARTNLVCRLWRTLNTDTTGEIRWKGLYSARWPLQKTPNSKTGLWCDTYRQKMVQSSVWQGKYFPDALLGHKAATRSIQVLPQHNLLASGSVDRTVKIWDLAAGMQIASSRLHNHTVRSLLLEPSSHHDDSVCLYSGSGSTIRFWKLTLPLETKVLGKPMKLKGHTGPITCLVSRNEILFSGSWDCSICLWKKKEHSLESRFVFHDWIWDLDVKQDRLFIACGKELVIHDLETTKKTTQLNGFLEQGHVTCCRATEDQRTVFSGSTDGFVRLHDLRSKQQMVEIVYHSSGVSGLSFENPWVAASSLDGTISLTNLESRLHPNLAFKRPQHGSQRRLVCPSGAVYCVHMTNQWLACGGDRPIVRTWDFTRAIEEAKKAEFSRSCRRQRRVPEFTEKQEVPYKIESIFQQQEDEEGGVSPDLVQETCRLEERSRTHWKSFARGDSTDESEIIEAFG